VAVHGIGFVRAILGTGRRWIGFRRQQEVDAEEVLAVFVTGDTGQIEDVFANVLVVEGLGVLGAVTVAEEVSLQSAAWAAKLLQMSRARAVRRASCDIV
jgi:hypothetical protein